MATRPTPRRAVSRQRYIVRRVGALALLVALGGLIALVLGGLGGSDDGSISGGGQPAGVGPNGGQANDDAGAAPGASGEADSHAVSAELGGLEPGGDGEASLTGGDGRGGDGVSADSVVNGGGHNSGGGDPPSAENPARVLIVGDSDAGTFGPYLQQLLRATGIVQTELDYKVSSGLARPDFYDWHAKLEQAVPAFDPDIVVVTFGGNDAQFLADRSGASVAPQPRPDADNSAWTAEYRNRVAQILDYLDADGRTVVWVGIPNHANPEVTFRMQYQDQAVKAEVAERPEIRFVDTWTRFAGRNGGFAEFVIDPRDGEGKRVRASDGFHLNQVGAEILAIDISQVIFDVLRERGASI